MTRVISVVEQSLTLFTCSGAINERVLGSTRPEKRDATQYQSGTAMRGAFVRFLSSCTSFSLPLSQTNSGSRDVGPSDVPLDPVNCK